MKRENAILLIIGILCIASPMSSSSVYGDSIVPKYKIFKIEEHSKFYVIYANYDKILYKILSKKINEKISSDRKQVQVLKRYPLIIQSLFLKEFMGHKMPRIGFGNANAVDYCNETILIEPEMNLYDIYDARNLDGLYLKIPSKYKVRSIKKYPKYYILYAQRNDTIVKIISKKTNTKKSSKYRIRSRKEYPLDLQTLFPKEYDGNGCLLSIDYSSPCIEYCGDTIYIEPEKGIKDIFIARNLDGLYLEDYY